MSAITKTANGCVYCRYIPGSNWQSHKINDKEGKVVCPYAIARNTCRYCKEYGHIKGTCPKLAEKEKLRIEQAVKLEKEFPALVEAKAPSAPPGAGAAAPSCVATVASFAKKLAENRPAKMAAALEKEAEAQRFAEANAKQKKREEWLKREEDRKLREKARRQTRELLHSSAMFEKYGTNWYNWVYGTDEDSNTAYELRRKEEEAYYREEEEIAKYCKEQQEFRKKLKNELSPSEFRDWEWEQADEYFDMGDRIGTEFSVRASPAALAYYSKTGIMHATGDFVSSEYGAELKTDKVLRERKERDQSKKTEETRLQTQCIFKYVKKLNKKR